MSDPVSEQQGYKFVMAFVSASEKFRQQFIEKWREVVANFIVDGAQTFGGQGGEISPYSRTKIYKSSRNKVFLRDPETHKLVMTYAAKLARTIYGDRQGKFVQAQPVGYEDVDKSQVVTRLLQYDFGLPGHFRTLVESLVDMILFGTSVVECYWRYEEREVVVRNMSSDGINETSSTTRGVFPFYDDVCLRGVDIMDFYPDPSRYRMEEMAGCAKKFRMNIFEAKRMVDSGYYRKDLMADMDASQPWADAADPPSFRRGLDQPANRVGVARFKDMIGYEYWGDVPEDEGVLDDETGDPVTRGVVTVINNKVARAKAWPLTDPRLPFYTFIINPVQGRFYGISPAEIVRFDQSFADAVKILLAEAIVRQVHPPIAYDSDAEFDVAKLREWKADLPIPVRGGPAAIGTLRYDANIQSGFSLLNGLKESIKEGSGALGGIQGENGPDRESASVGTQRIQFALDRPELAGMILESECLPPIAKAMLKRNQQFIEDTDDLKKRVGELPEPFWIGDILGDFDVRFVGSRNSMSNQEKLASLQTLAQFGTAFPAFQAMMPNAELAQEIVGEILNLPEAAAQIGDVQRMMQNVALTQAMGQAQGMGGPAQNGVPIQPQPIAPIAQLAGRPTS